MALGVRISSRMFEEGSIAVALSEVHLLSYAFGKLSRLRTHAILVRRLAPSLRPLATAVLWIVLAADTILGVGGEISDAG